MPMIFIGGGSTASILKKRFPNSLFIPEPGPGEEEALVLLFDFDRALVEVKNVEEAKVIIRRLRSYKNFSPEASIWLLTPEDSEATFDLEALDCSALFHLNNEGLTALLDALQSRTLLKR